MAEAAVKNATKRKAKAKSENGDESVGARAKLRARKITLVAKENPKRKGSKSFERFSLYRNGMSIGDFLEKGGTMGDIRYDTDAKFIELSKE